MGSAFSALLARDLAVALGRWSDIASPLLFFLLVAALIPLALAPTPDVLRAVGPAVVWAAALLSTLMAMPALFRADLEDGSLEQLLLAPHPLALLVLAKVAAQWLVSGLPLVLLAPLVASAYYLPADTFGVLSLALLLGTPVLTLVGAIGAALTAGLRQGGALLALLILPLMLPVLIFGARATALAAAGEAATAPLTMLAAFLCLAVSLAPLAAAAALRISAD